MRIRIATKGWKATTAADSLAETEVGVGVQWVELDGQRTNAVTKAIVESEQGVTMVTLTFIAAAEMVLVDSKGEILA